MNAGIKIARTVALARRTRAAVAIAGVATVILAAAPQALATGGQSIGAAPTVLYGQQEFGNTATDSSTTTCSGSQQNSWWLLPVTAGDKITIDFEGSGAQYQFVWPVGTTDYNVEETDTYEYAELSDNGKQEASFTAPRTGSMPLDFSTYDCDFGDFGTPGPYDFTTYVHHAAVLGLPALSTIGATGTIPVGVHTPDGGAISTSGLSVSLQGRAPHGQWLTVGVASPITGTATIPYKMPSGWVGEKVKLRAVGEGSAYKTATSSGETVEIQPASTSTSHHKKHHHHKKHRHKKHHHRKHH